MAPSMDNIPTQRQAENGYLVDKDARNIHKPEPLSIRPDPCQDDPSSFFRTSDAMPDSVIMEEDEETASELAEPITPVSDGQPLEFPQHPRKQELEAERPDEPRMHREPLVLNTDGASHRERPPSSSNSTAKSSPLRTASRSIKKSLFRGQNANSQYQSDGVVEDGNGSPRESKESSRGSFLTSIRKGSFSSPSRNSPQTSQSNSPHSPGSPTSTLNSNTNHAFGSSTPSETSSIMKRPFRSSTGLSLRDRSRVVFGSTPKPTRATEKIRSPSMDDIQSRPERPGFSIPAVSGAGLKARRMSATLPDDFTVETCELSDEFVSPSRVPLRKGKEIGSGATATVSIMIRKGGSKDEQFAVKEFRKRSQKEEKAEYEKKVKSEFSIAKSLDHPNIIKTIMLCTHNGRWNHVMEYCPKGELFTLVQKGYMDLESKLCLFKQLLRGVSYLHENGIAHRDIKLENLLLSDEGHLKITDFGVSEVFSGIHPGLRSSGGECGKEMNEIRLCSPGICGSLPYIAPEVLAKKGDYDPRPLDVWSCAIVFLTMYFNGNPWPSADSSHRNYARYERGWKRFLDRRPDGVILEEDVPKCGPAFSLIHNSALRRLLLRMLHPDPNMRISIHDALNDRWVNTIECCCVDPSETENIVTSIDVADKDSSKLASRMIVQKMHNHFPPTPKKFP